MTTTHPRSRRRQSGLALLCAMLVTVLVIVIAAEVNLRALTAIAATARVLEASAAEHAFMELEAAAASALLAAARRADAPTEDDESDAAARGTPTWPVFTTRETAATARGMLGDMQARFNLTNLAFDADHAAQALVPTESGSGAEPGDDTSGDDTDPGSVLGGPQSGDEDADNAYETTDEDADSAYEATDEDAPDDPADAEDDDEAGDARLAAAMAALAELPGVIDGAQGVQAGAEGVTLSPQQVAAARFLLLLRALELPDEILPAVLDWIDSDSETRFPNGAEDDYYGDLDPPYRAANRALASVDELKLVRGIDARTFAKLAPHICALPQPAPINLNSASKEILMSLAPSIDSTTAEMLDKQRRVQPFVDVAQVLSLPLMLARPLVEEGLATTSEYYHLDMEAVAGQSQIHARSLIARNAPDAVTVVDRQRGVLP